MKRQKRTPDFSGWATKYGIKCSDGRTILPGAFSEMEGKKVPIVWGHIHDDPDMVLGHAYLYNRPEGMWAEGYFNNNPKALSTKEALRNEDVDGLSIYANELKHVNGRQVQHGNIRELSVVLAGANKGATRRSSTATIFRCSMTPKPPGSFGSSRKKRMRTTTKTKKTKTPPTNPKRKKIPKKTKRRTKT